MRIRFSNALAEPTIVHWHGLDMPAAMDGHPHSAIEPRREFVYEFEVTNRAGTYWYHPHPHNRTGPQVYNGLAGLLLIDDDEERALNLPGGSEELACVLQDRRFDARNQLMYLSGGMMEQAQGFLGDRVLVNGLERPSLALATRAYRLRLLNGSNARIYKLAWSDGTPMTVIGTDGGLLQQPAQQRYLTLAPGQRADVILDLTRRDLARRSSCEVRRFHPSRRRHGHDGDGAGHGHGQRHGYGRDGAARGAERRVAVAAHHSRRAARDFRLSSACAALDVRQLMGKRAHCTNAPRDARFSAWAMAAGRAHLRHDRRGARRDRCGRLDADLGVRQWAGMMGMQMAHPIHLHGRQFRVVSRQGSAAAGLAVREGLVDSGWLDTVLVMPGETVRIKIPFTRHPGLYLYHCHILEHEDMGMMRNFRVV